ncbi:MAG: UbiA family prenyltransferase [Candidatus Riflebacteria bacterium]|nr:UbiA family prenyltransferase [Candidatus Riflebacteria bacterium]
MSPSRPPGLLSDLVRLVRLPLCLAVTATAAGAHVLAAQRVAGSILVVAPAVLLLACGASALNQWQERAIDRAMPRTRDRPVPAGRIGPTTALVLSAGSIAVGLAALGLGAGPVPALLGAAAIGWYNGLYTALKRVTAFAVVPGAVVGAIPPAIGWVAAGQPLDLRLAAIAFFFWVWQVPHFWLLVLRFGDEYREAGLPVPSARLTPMQLTRLAATWLCLAAVCGLLLPVFGAVRSWPVVAALALAAAAMTGQGLKLLTQGPAAGSAPGTVAAVTRLVLAVALLMALDPYLAR